MSLPWAGAVVTWLRLGWVARILGVEVSCRDFGVRVGLLQLGGVALPGLCGWVC